MPKHDVDIIETSQHDIRRNSDLALLAACGVRRVRYPVRWHRIEQVQGQYDWTETDEVLGYLHDQGFSPIVDMLHHTAYPIWLTGFDDPRFGDAYLKFCEAFARRYPGTNEYTLFNEPFTTMFLCGHEGIWPPYGRGMESFVALSNNVLPAFFEATRMYKDLLPNALHVYVEPCEGHAASITEGNVWSKLANDRRFFIIDRLLGRDIDPGAPFVAEVAGTRGGDRLLELKAGNLDILGLDYYAHMEWYHADDGVGQCPSKAPLGLAALIMQYSERYSNVPLILGETNIRGYASDRASWLKYTLEQCELAQSAGANLIGYCWYPFIDSLDWDSLLANADRHIDPVGVYWLDEKLDRHASVMSDAYKLAASGAPSSALPAYTFQPDVKRRVECVSGKGAGWRSRCCKFVGVGHHGGVTVQLLVEPVD
ncbi:MAG TPA: family 1 glycosylhydrolase, partial [Actinomycetota bacterium]|nr:family 1 glycosylhydrolase [Actinomycetota bacterium]